MKRTFGADIGYSSGKNSSSLKVPPSNGLSLGPATTTWKYLALLSSGTASIPETGSCINLCVSLRILLGNPAAILPKEICNSDFQNPSWDTLLMADASRTIISANWLNRAKTATNSEANLLSAITNYETRTAEIWLSESCSVLTLLCMYLLHTPLPGLVYSLVYTTSQTRRTF
eukprot:scpid92156/ scgid10719/ 